MCHRVSFGGILELHHLDRMTVIDKNATLILSKIRKFPTQTTSDQRVTPRNTGLTTASIPTFLPVWNPEQRLFPHARNEHVQIAGVFAYRRPNDTR
jgi:hypothetical protein